MSRKSAGHRMAVAEILEFLREHGSEKNREGMKRFGIVSDNAFGVPVPVLRSLAKQIGKDHELAAELWETKFHEALLLAVFIDEPEKVTLIQMNAWAKRFYSWDLCDQCCMNLFDKTPFAYERAIAWSRQKQEFVKRAGFAMMATLAVHDKKAPDAVFIPFLVRIEEESDDERNFVRKAVNWALRQIGKRNERLHKTAMQSAHRVLRRETKAARWIATDALREFKSETTLRRLKRRATS